MAIIDAKQLILNLEPLWQNCHIGHNSFLYIYFTIFSVCCQLFFVTKSVKKEEQNPSLKINILFCLNTRIFYSDISSERYFKRSSCFSLSRQDILWSISLVIKDFLAGPTRFLPISKSSGVASLLNGIPFLSKKLAKLLYAEA